MPVYLYRFFASNLCFVILLEIICRSHFPMYGLLLHLRHSTRYITSLLLQLRWWNILYSLPDSLNRLRNLFVLTMCLQHLLSILVKHGEHFPITFSFFLTTVPLLILVCPISSFRFWFRRKHSTGFCGNLAATAWLIITVAQVDVVPVSLFFVFK